MKLIEIVNKIDVKKINVKKDEFHKLEDIQILKIEEERRKMAKNSLLFLDKEEIEKLNNNEIKILINDLREKEVKAIVLETDTQNLKEIEKELENINIVLICTDNLENAKIKVALEFYAYPEKELKIIGVVGTRGKTTTAFIIREILEKAGIRTGLITTMYTMIEDKIVMQNQGKMPRILDFFKILRVMSNESIMYVIMETPVSSIKEGLMSNINFAYTVFTNIIKEEINKEKYGNTMKCLENTLEVIRNSQKVVVNEDCVAREYVKRNAKKCMTYGITNKSTIMPTNINIRNIYTEMTLKIEKNILKIKMSLIGKTSVYNACAAAALAHMMGIGADKIKEGIESVIIPGKREVVANKLDIPIMIDGGRDKQRIESLLKELRKYVTGRISVVIGANEGDTKEKLFELGVILGKNAEIINITTGNPGKDNEKRMSNEILAGVRTTEARGYIDSKLDRKQIIELILSKAEKRDYIVLLGIRI